jgi:lambda family phage portal protein
VRDLFRTNPLYQAYRETVWANVFGSEGIMLRMNVLETEDRVINTPEEKFLESEANRRNEVLEFFAKKEGREFKAKAYFTARGLNGSRVAKVSVGEPDIYANLLIQRKWKEWQRREFCDSRQTRNYKTQRQLRLISAIRDGDFFIRLIRDPRVNKFGFSTQLINAEWCDRFYNTICANGNVVRMGIEYENSAWGIGKPVAYYFIKRQPMDWQFSIPGAFNFSGGSLHDRVPAEEIIHYARAVDADSTRPAPWVASTIPSSRQRDQAMIAETIAWRASACKTGWLESTIVPEGGYAGDALPSPDKIRGLTTEPGGIIGLPYGVTYKDSDPRHPNANVKEFRMASIQDGCAGMPGSNYSTMANDYAAINFSAGRLQRLDCNETNALLQEFDIDYAERIIFEAWLEMALVMGEIPLPLIKFDKFNKPVFTGRRWQGVDPVKDANASALEVANKFSSRTRECAARGRAFSEVLFELAREEMEIEELGMTSVTTVEGVKPAQPAQDEADNEPSATEAAATPTKKPAPKKPAKSRLTVSVG